jgi:hypothetical protein
VEELEDVKQQEVVRFVEGGDVQVAGERDEPGAEHLLGRTLGVVVHLVRFAAADECVPNTLLGVSFLDYPDRLVEIEVIALADTHV